MNPQNPLDPQLTALWKQTFGDSDQYINTFARAWHISRHQKLFTLPDGAPAAMLFAPECPAIISSPEGIHDYIKGKYLCALATLPKLRRKGIMSAMIRDTIDHEKKLQLAHEKSEGKPSPHFLCLIPASLHLRKYYESFGFKSLNNQLTTILTISPNHTTPEIETKSFTSAKQQDNPAFEAMIEKIHNYRQKGVWFQISHSREKIIAALADHCNDGGWVTSHQGWCAWIIKTGEHNYKVPYFNVPTSTTLLNLIYSSIPSSSVGLTTITIIGTPLQKSILEECGPTEDHQYGMILWLGPNQDNIPPLGMPLMMD